MNATVTDFTGPDGGYVISDHGHYAVVEEFILSNELEPEFVRACGEFVEGNIGIVR